MNIKKLILFLVFAGICVPAIATFRIRDGHQPARAIFASLMAAGVCSVPYLKSVSLPLSAAFCAVQGLIWYRAIRETIKDNLYEPFNLRPLVRAFFPLALDAHGVTKDNIDQVNARGETLLIRAAQQGKTALMRYCIAQGADLNKIDNTQKSALVYAVEWADIENIKLLVFAGAHVRPALVTLLARVENISSGLQNALRVGASVLYVVENAGRIERLNEGPFRQLTEVFKFLMQDAQTMYAELSESQKSQYKAMLISREKIKRSLHGSLLLYQYFDHAEALKKYLKYGTQVAQGMQEPARVVVDEHERSRINKQEHRERTGIRSGLPKELFAHTMSFLREKPISQEKMLNKVLRKAIAQDNKELQDLLEKYGAVAIGYEEDIRDQFFDSSTF